ncbi:MAG: hypothetical protein IH794_07770 [Acidobacteria bacterium]|nr:hypothetical protein [Acidobacteriota bacterium]
MSGTQWFFAVLLGFGLLSFWFTSLREQPPPLAPTQTDISETVEPQEKEIPLQVIEHSVLRDWKPNRDYRGLGLEILVSDEATEEELIELIQTLAGRREHVNIRVYSSNEAYRQEQRQSYGDAYKRGYLLFYIKNLTGRGPFDGLNEIRWMQETGHLSHKRGEKMRF